MELPGEVAAVPGPPALVAHPVPGEPPGTVPLLEHGIVEGLQVDSQLVFGGGWRRGVRGDGVSGEALGVPELYSQYVVVGGYVGARGRERDRGECQRERARRADHLYRRARAD